MELDELRDRLTSVIDPRYLEEWLQSPNDALDGLEPREVIARGETERILRMIYLLESGVPI